MTMIDEHGEITDVAVTQAPVNVLVSNDPTEQFQKMTAFVQVVAQQCKGPQFIADIQGKPYPTVQWWTTIGASLGMFPREVRSEKKTDDDGKMAYEAYVEVFRDDHLITSASAICSRSEHLWANRDEYAIKSMATTRATAKAFRLGLSYLAVLAGLQPTPAEEMMGVAESDAARSEWGVCATHGTPYFKSANMSSPAHKYGADNPKEGTVGATSPKKGEALRLTSALIQTLNTMRLSRLLARH